MMDISLHLRMNSHQLYIVVLILPDQSVTGQAGNCRMYARHTQCQRKNLPLLHRKWIVLFFCSLIQQHLQFLLKMLAIHHRIRLLFLCRQRIAAG